MTGISSDLILEELEKQRTSRSDTHCVHLIHMLSISDQRRVAFLLRSQGMFSLPTQSSNKESLYLQSLTFHHRCSMTSSLSNTDNSLPSRRPKRSFVGRIWVMIWDTWAQRLLWEILISCLKLSKGKMRKCAFITSYCVFQGHSNAAKSQKLLGRVVWLHSRCLPCQHVRLTFRFLSPFRWNFLGFLIVSDTLL